MKPLKVSLFYTLFGPFRVCDISYTHPKTNKHICWSNVPHQNVDYFLKKIEKEHGNLSTFVESRY